MAAVDASFPAGRLDPRPTVLVIMGVSGSGKSTVAEALQHRLGWASQEGDDLHPAANIEKMTAGQPLSDSDRAPWLDAVAAWIDEQQSSGEPGIVTCSALRRRYRDVLRRDGVIFVVLQAPTDVLRDRLQHRHGHFMGAGLLTSQLDTLEPPGVDERSLSVPAQDDPTIQAEQIVERLGLSSTGT
jgi:gluconokinase/shikimate kinase